MVATVSAGYFAALRYPCTFQTTVTHRNLVTAVTTKLDVLDGDVTIDSAAAIRRTLNLTLPGVEATFAVLDTPGGEISVQQKLRETGETVRLGVFIVDQAAIDYTPGGTISLTCPDRWLKVQRNRFGLTNRASVPGNAAWQEIQRLIVAAWPGTTYPFPGWASVDTTATTKVGSLMWADGDREAAIAEMLKAHSLQAFFNETGQGVIRQTPVLSVTSTSVWTVDANTPTAVLTAANRTRDLSTVRNAVVASTSATDIVFNPVEVKNTTAGDPLNVTGTLGYVPLEYSSPLLRNSTQAHAAAVTLLSKHMGSAKQLTLEALSNPALDADDVILVRVPRIDANHPRPVELHIIDSVKHSLTRTSPLLITTRSTRPASDTGL